jgi:predicted metal-dependent enzyme (double-stranded beta helix superfamily)
MFDKERFIEDCMQALSGGQRAVRDVVKRAVSQPSGIINTLGEPVHAGITPLYRSSDLTILNFAWAPCMNLMPHNHNMFAVIGIYTGREDNIIWRKTPDRIEATSAQSLGVGDVATLGQDAIHSVLNPLTKMTCAIHVYGGDFFAPDEPRSEWDSETLIQSPWDGAKVQQLFEDAEARFQQHP